MPDRGDPSPSDPLPEPGSPSRPRDVRELRRRIEAHIEGRYAVEDTPSTQQIPTVDPSSTMADPSGRRCSLRSAGGSRLGAPAGATPPAGRRRAVREPDRRRPVGRPRERIGRLGDGDRHRRRRLRGGRATVAQPGTADPGGHPSVYVDDRTSAGLRQLADDNGADGSHQFPPGDRQHRLLYRYCQHCDFELHHHDQADCDVDHDTTSPTTTTTTLPSSGGAGTTSG